MTKFAASVNRLFYVILTLMLFCIIISIEFIQPSQVYAKNNDLITCDYYVSNGYVTPNECNALWDIYQLSDQQILQQNGWFTRIPICRSGVDSGWGGIGCTNFADGRGYVITILVIINFCLTQIPPSITAFSELQQVYFSGQSIHGSIPNQIGELTKLNWLDIFDTNISGDIPSSLGQLTNLVTLHVGNNHNLSGVL